ncbi:RAB30 [Mytilus edulis]|uniref:RAB30 n=1 Tax=Mytilus edulis TaxID=6550 RepID=A0A8S3VCA6_MYTED|nr:RAB30 [Mytilus edulis]
MTESTVVEKYVVELLAWPKRLDFFDDQPINRAFKTQQFSSIIYGSINIIYTKRYKHGRLQTCLVRRFTQGLFPPGQGATIGVDFMIKTVEIDGEKVKLQIWDTAGQERFRSITQSYYRSANSLILVYDVCCQASFDSLPTWIQEIETYASTKFCGYLVGNKTDKINDKEIPTHIGQQFADRYEMDFIETSAKEADNVDKLFYTIAKKLSKEAKQGELISDDTTKFNTDNTTSISNCSGCLKF